MNNETVDAITHLEGCPVLPLVEFNGVHDTRRHLDCMEEHKDVVLLGVAVGNSVRKPKHNVVLR